MVLAEQDGVLLSLSVAQLAKTFLLHSHCLGSKKL